MLADKVNTVAPRSEDPMFDPLEDAWQEDGTGYAGARHLVDGERERLAKLATQPSQLFRWLATSVALAADLGGWTEYVNLPESQESLAELTKGVEGTRAGETSDQT